MNTPIESTLLWLTLALLSILAICAANYVERKSRKYYTDRAMVFVTGFFTAIAGISTVLFLASL